MGRIVPYIIENKICSKHFETTSQFIMENPKQKMDDLGAPPF